MNKREKGFSLVELLIVVAIIVVLAAISIPNIQRLSATYKIDASGHTTAGLLAQARLQAVHNNAPAYAHPNVNLAFVNNDPAQQTFVSGNPDIELSGGVQFQNVGMPDHQQLDNYLGANGGGGPSVKIGTPIGFNARGLPCVESGIPIICLQQDGAGGPVPVFEWFMTDGNGNWEAVTVTAAGRIRAWRYTGQNTWQ